MWPACGNARARFPAWVESECSRSHEGARREAEIVTGVTPGRARCSAEWRDDSVAQRLLRLRAKHG